MSDTAKRFSSLLTVICRTAKRSANKMAKIRKKKNGGAEEISNLPTKADVVGSPCRVTRAPQKSASNDEDKGTIILQVLFILCRVEVEYESEILTRVLLFSVEQQFNETYELHHLLGQGGFAVVYSGTRVRDGLAVSDLFSCHWFTTNSWLGEKDDG